MLALTISENFTVADEYDDIFIPTSSQGLKSHTIPWLAIRETYVRFPRLKIMENYIWLVKKHFLCVQYPGPNEAGLAFDREMTGKYPLVLSAWRGPMFPLIVCVHPQTVKPILATGGTISWHRV